jgi:hypothetical protein
MNREDIIQMARDSGMELYGLGKNREKFLYHLERFFHMAQVAEREECAKLIEPSADHRENFNDYLGGEQGIPLLDHLAAVIRARGQA